MAKTVFDHIDAITVNQNLHYFDLLDDADKKSFNVYIINLALSMNPRFLPLVNELNKYWNIGPREVYIYYSQVLPKGKQYNKWIKKKSDTSYDDALVGRIAYHFEVSQSNAVDYLRIFYKTPDSKKQLKILLQGYGITDKELKKLKL